MEVLSDVQNKFYVKLENKFSDFNFYYTKEWHEFLECSMGWKVNFLVDYGTSGELRFCIPIISKRRLLKKVWLALPLSHNVEPFFNNEVSWNEVQEILLKEEISVLEMYCKNGDYVNKEVTVDNSNVDVVINIKNKKQKEVFNEFSKSSIQRKIKKARKSGVVVKEVNNLEGYKIFADLQLETRIRQGSLMYPSGYFSKLFEVFKKTDYVKLFLAYYENQPVAGIIYSYYKNKAIYLYGASVTNRDYYRMGVNQITMWRAIQEAIDREIEFIELGKTPKSNTGLLNYKKKWNGEVVELRYLQIKIGEGESNQIKRDGKLTKLANLVLSKTPKPIFKRVTPIILKIFL